MTKVGAGGTASERIAAYAACAERIGVEPCEVMRTSSDGRKLWEPRTSVIVTFCQREAAERFAAMLRECKAPDEMV